MDDKEVHFTNKRVDESWKENISKEKTGQTKETKSDRISFSAFVTSIGIQALIHLGELKAPGSKEAQTDLNAVQETIDLLLMLKEKTKGNLTSDEKTLLTSLIADLQFKFVHHQSPS